ncbi:MULTISPECIES: hypothetical protein [Sphingomonas]|nr:MULTISPECIES: hypothetical protein [Sphingomonas]
MMAVATSALFASAAAIAVTTIVAAIVPQRGRIARMLRHGPEWTVGV